MSWRHSYQINLKMSSRSEQLISYQSWHKTQEIEKQLMPYLTRGEARTLIISCRLPSVAWFETRHPAAKVLCLLACLRAAGPTTPKNWD